MSYFNNENRLAKILKIIERSNSATSSSIASKLDVSTKTVKNDIKEINELLKGYGLIELKQGKYRLYIIDQKNFEKEKLNINSQDYMFNSPKKRVAYILNKLMNSEIPYLIDDLAEEMNIGRTTLVGDLKKLRTELKKHDIDIKGKTNNGLILKGSELSLRIFILDNMYDLIYMDYNIDKDIIDSIREIAKKNHLGPSTIEYFIKTFTLMIDRLLNGYEIKDIDPKYKELANTKAYKLIELFTEEIEKKIHTKIPQNEKLFVTLPIVGMRTPMNIDGAKHIQVSEEAIELVDEIVEFINKEMNIKIIPGDLFDEFLYHITFMINRLKFNIKLKNPVIEDIKEKYSVAYKMAELSKYLIEKKFNLKLSKDEVGFLAIYFGVFISENNYENNKIYKIAIMCGTGRVTARLIKSQLKKIIDYQAQIDLYSTNEVTDELLDDYDLVLSTINIKSRSLTPIIYLDAIFDESKLRQKIEQVKFTKKLEVPLLQGMDSVLLSLLDEDKFFILDKNLSYEENIDLMIDNLYENEYVDFGFKERMKIREANSTMVFDKNIAFPHVINYESDKVVLALGVFDEKINSKDNKGVKLVFLLGIPEDVGVDETILIKIYNEIISISNNDKVIEDISKFKNYRDVLLYFIRENDILN
ncbi:BglG family transcription antiterminator [Paraclostridium bifermentans]|uniref:BglG family transcription antiterminator n=1 Tax=Paraclostridium bifermentans TaxID=1490 RepID=UPI00359C458A